MSELSVIEDIRNVLQDFLAPELRAISARLDALEKKVDANEARAETRHSEVMAGLRQINRLYDGAGSAIEA